MANFRIPRIAGPLLFLILGALPFAARSGNVAEPVSGNDVKSGGDRGVVLLAVRWDRRWKCGAYENAQLRVIGFDKLPSTKPDDGATADLVLDDAPLIMTKPVFDNYAFALEPGEYALSRLEIKVARSISDVGFFKIFRSQLIKDGQGIGGTFTVAPGEVVYLGHFYLDCATSQPTMWRFYPDGRADFSAYLSSLKRIYPALDTDKVVFRLFKTKDFGNEYQLP